MVSDGEKNPIKFKETAVYEGIYEIFEDELSKIGRYIALTDDNFDTYSNKIHELHLRVCSEVENTLKAVVHNYFVPESDIKFLWEKNRLAFLEKVGDDFKEQYEDLVKKLGSEKRTEKLDRNIIGSSGDFSFYLKIARDKFHLDKKVVHFRRAVPAITNKLESMQVFNCDSNGRAPDWWGRYNDIKHNKIDGFDKCRLGDLIHAMAGLYILITYLVRYSKGNQPAENYNHWSDELPRIHGGCDFLKYPSHFFDPSYSADFMIINELSISDADKEYMRRSNLSTDEYKKITPIIQEINQMAFEKKTDCIFHVYYDYRAAANIDAARQKYGAFAQYMFMRKGRYGVFIN